MFVHQAAGEWRQNPHEGGQSQRNIDLCSRPAKFIFERDDEYAEGELTGSDGRSKGEEYGSGDRPAPIDPGALY
jgi:hypothetical protein